jgi:hypothetical protein
MLNIAIALVALSLVFSVVGYLRDRRNGRRADLAAGGIASAIGTLAILGALSVKASGGLLIGLVSACAIAVSTSFYLTYRGISRKQ